MVIMQQFLSRWTSLLLVAGSTAACHAQRPTGPAMHSPNPTPVEGTVRVEVVASGLHSPWGFAFLPDARIIVTEKLGTLRIVGLDGKISAPLSRCCQRSSS